jgi:hypothetical protein
MEQFRGIAHEPILWPDNVQDRHHIYRYAKARK